MMGVFMKNQLAVLEKELQILKNKADIEGILLIGSVAYGTASESSDLDLIVICSEDRFLSKYTDEILVEIHFNKFSTLVKKLKANPIEVYKYLYSKIIMDNGKSAKLISMANNIYCNYSTPSNEKESICYWLLSTKIKLKSAIYSNDNEKASYLISTNTWKVLEGVWAKNNKPMPPSSLVFEKHGELKAIPFDGWFDRMLLGDCLKRAVAMIDIIDWICAE